jgi:Flp pilus assembly protein TadG
MTDVVREAGSVTAFVVALAMAFVACMALAVDGGRVIAAAVAAGDHAENAARAGVQHLESLRSGSPSVDRPAARNAAHAYLSRHGVDGEVTASEQRVTVRTTVVVQLPLLALLGVGEHRVTAERSAEPVSEP